MSLCFPVRRYHVNSDRKVEIQLRTIEQHNWATLVEIVDLIYGTKIKEGKIDNKDLKYFLYLFSKKNDLLKKEIKDLISIEQKSRIYEKMCNVFSKNFLKITNHVQMSDKFHGAFFRKLNSDLHSKHLLHIL